MSADLLARYGAILHRLGRCRADRTGLRGTALCPVPEHADRNPSLSWFISDKGDLIMHCRRGCPFPAIAAALDCDPKEFWRPTEREQNGAVGAYRRKARQQRECVAFWDYLDEGGRVLYRKLRWATGPDGLGKTYSFQRPDGAGKWLSAPGCMEGVRRVPYNLPAVIDPANAGRLVAIPEGEKKCDMLSSLGILATTNDDGTDVRSRRWRAEYTRLILSTGPRPVVVMPDDNDTGRGHANDVVGSLIQAGAESVRVLAVTGHGEGAGIDDVIDTLRRDGNDDRAAGRVVRQMIRNAPEWSLVRRAA